MKKLFKRWITPFVLNNFPFIITTQVNKFNTILVKKGKSKEWRTFTIDGRRMQNVIK